MSTIADTYCPRLKCFQPVLRKWVKLNEQMADAWRSWPDTPWWDNERSSLSVIAGAIWLTGGVAFEECTGKKRSAPQRSLASCKEYSGRLDIYMEVNGDSFIGEAKFCWPGASATWGNQAKYMTQFLDHAKRDIRKSTPYGQRRVAMTFASPYLTKCHKAGIRERIEHFVDQIREMDADAAAWVFPDFENSVSFSKWLYPGTAVMIKEVKR